MQYQTCQSMNENLPPCCGMRVCVREREREIKHVQDQLSRISKLEELICHIASFSFLLFHTPAHCHQFSLVFFIVLFSS